MAWKLTDYIEEIDSAFHYATANFCNCIKNNQISP